MTSPDPLNPTPAAWTPPAGPPPAAAPPPVYVQPELPPKPKALFSLDDLENEKTAEPFIFDYQGATFELLDPQDLDWQDLMVAQENPRLMIHIIMPEEQRPIFLEKKLPMRKLEALLKRWQQHFGLPTAGEAEGSARS